MSGEDHKHGIKMSTGKKQTMKNEFPTRLPIEAGHSTTRIQIIPRLKLQSTKSFPPYSERRGGFGEESAKRWDMISQCSSPSCDEEGEKELDQPSERKNSDREVNRRFAKANRRAKWGRWERLETGSEADSWRWECSNKNDYGSEKEGQFGESVVEEEGKWRQHRKLSLSQDIRRDDVQGRCAESTQETPKKDDEPPEKTENSSTHHSPVPHPILSKLLHSTSSSTSSSTSGFSSAESDEVFSDKEDAVSKRATFRKVRTRDITFKIGPQTICVVAAVLLFCEVVCSFINNHSDEFEKEI